MKRAVLIAGSIVVLCFGVAFGMEFMPPHMGMGGMTNCAPIETTMGLLDLSKEQGDQVRGLAQTYGKDYEAETSKVRVALDEKYLGEVKKVLTDQQKTQLDALMAADKKCREGVQKADDAYRAKLTELLYKDQPDKAVVDRELRFLPRDQNLLLDRYMTAQKDTFQKYQALRDEKGKAIAEVYQKNKADQKDLKAIQEWRETTTRLTKEAEQKFSDQSLALLGDEQKKSFESVKAAQKEWTDATAAAEGAYTKEVEAVIGPEKAGQAQMFLRGRAMRYRF